MSIATSLARLRAQHNLSQEKLAEQLQVSRQAIQKWESGLGTPDLINIIRISKHFGVSIDSLVTDGDRRTCELQSQYGLQPEYSTMHPWDTYSHDLLVEYRQCLEEGLDVKPYESLFQGVSQMPAGALKSRMADVLFDLVCSLPMAEGYAYDEPSDLEGIRALSLEGEKAAVIPYDAKKIHDKLLGAWLGRIAGCMLGKTVECIRTNELHPLLKESGNWPMHRYILTTDVTDEMIDRFSFPLKERCYADKLEYMPIDDDTNYTVLGQLLIERYGRDFTSDHVAQLWLDSQPKNAYCTAERVAFRNFILGYRPPQSAQFQNPYREWIGAQIRADYFGYINPGNPAMAAEMAWRDARISHIKNGIYGEMFVAAMLAQAAVDTDMLSVIRAGLHQIPSTSRLHESVTSVIDGFLGGVSKEDCMAKIHSQWDEFDGHDWCHTISNAMLVVASLLYGEGDFGKSICMSVQEGFDTDCNGATVGSIVGMLYGSSAIGEEWTKPLHGKLQTSIFGIGIVEIEKLVEKTISQLA